MFERSAGLINWGRYYRGTGLEQSMSFEKAAQEYRRLLISGSADSLVASQAAEFLFFSSRYSELEELKEILLSPALICPDTLAYCAYTIARHNIEEAYSLFQHGRDLYPDHEPFLNDILRLQALKQELATVAHDADNESELDTFSSVAGSIYLLLFLAIRRIISELPAETESAFEILYGLAATDIERRDSMLLEADYAATCNKADRLSEILSAAQKEFPEDYEVLTAAARYLINPMKEAHPTPTEEALGLADRAIYRRPWYPDAHTLRGDVLVVSAEEALAAGNESLALTLFQEAAQGYERSITLDPHDDNSAAQLLLTLGALRSGTEIGEEIEGFRRRADELIGRLPAGLMNDPAELARLGRNIFESGLESEGDQLIQIAEGVLPEHPEILHARGTVQFARAMRESTTRETSLRLFEAAASFRQAFEAEPAPDKKSRYLLILASVYRELKDSDRELAILQAGERLALPDEEIYLTLSEVYHNQHNIAAGIRALESGFRVLPGSPDLGIEIARCYSRDTRFTEAVGIVDNMLETYPASPWIWNQMGIIQVEWGTSITDNEEEQRGHYLKACDAYDQARRLSPEDFTFQGNYGDALRLCDELDLAEQHLRLALRLNSGDVFSLNSLGLLFGERAKKEKTRERQEYWLKEAEGCLQRASLLEPTNPAFEINLADLYYDFGFFEDTIDIYQRLIETEEDAWQYYDIIGLCFYHTGHLQDAARWFSDAMDKQPQAPEVINSLGLCYYGSGKINEAIEYFKQASLLDPENSVYLDNIVMAQYNQKGYSSDYRDGPRM